MNTTVKILIAGHDQHDRKMINNELHRSGLNYVIGNVENENDYRQALSNFLPDVILCDFVCSSFDGLAALKIRNELTAEIPFLVLSATAGEEIFNELIEKGATDLVLKDKLFTLNIRLQRALKEAKEKKERYLVESALKETAAHLAEAQKLAKLGSWDYDFVTNKLVWSEQLYRVFDTDKQIFDGTYGSFLALVDEPDRENIERITRHTQETGDPFILNYGITTPKGEKRIIEEHGYGVKDTTGKVIRSFGTAQDITERIRSEEEVKKANEEKNAVFERIDDGFFAVDTNSLVTYWNRKAEILLEEKREDNIGRNLHEMFGGPESRIFYDNYQKAISEKSTVHFEGFSVRSNKWFAVSAFGSDSGLSVYFRDITEQKNDQERLKESELRYRSLIEHASDAICIIDANMRFIEINKVGCQNSGYSREEMLQLSVTDILFEEDLETNPLKIPTLAPGTTFLHERRLKKKDGTVLEMELSGKKLEDGSVMIFIRDISERKKATQLIWESEAKYRAFFENSIDGILLTVTDGDILAANPAACRIFGMTEAEICRVGRMGIADVTDPRLTQLIQERQNTGSCRGEVTLIRKDGSKFPGDVSSARFIDAFGHERTSMIVRDISDQKTAELNLNKTSKELQQTLSGLNKIMDSSLDVISTVNGAGQVVQVSAASQAIWGYSPEELLNMNYIDLVYADDVEKTIAVDSQIKNGLSVTIFENRYVHKNGSIVPMLWSASWDKNDNLMYCIGKDATEKKRLEKAVEIERQRFLDLYFLAPSGMGILKGPNHVFEMANPVYLRLIDKTDIIGKTVQEVMPELESQGIIGVLDHVYNTGETFTANEMLVQFDPKGNGEMVSTYLSFIYQAHRNNDGIIDGIFFFGNDVTEQVVSRHKIEQTGNLYRQIVETAQEGIWMIDENDNTSFVNKKMCDILEYTEEEVMGNSIYSFMNKGADQVAAMANTLKGHAGQDHFKYLSKSGKEIWLNFSANPIFNEDGSYTGALAMVTDITEKKHAELQLNQSNERYNLVSKATNDMVWDWDLINSKVYRNEEGWKKIFGSDDNVMQNESIDIWNERVHPEDQIVIKQVEDEIQNSNSDSFEVECRMLKDDGTYIYVHDKGYIVRDAEGKAIRLIGATQDITERKTAEAAVLSTLTEKNTILESIGDAFFALDQNWIVTYWNNHAATTLGVSKEEIVGKNLWDVFTEGVDSFYREYHAAVTTNRVVHFEEYFSPQCKWFEVSAYPSKTGLAVYFKDITDRKLSEIKLIELNENLELHAKELAISNMELEQFAYVASHDLQEPLRMVTSFLTQLEKRYGDVIDDKGKRYIYFAVDGAKRMRQIIIDLLEFSRVGRTEDKQVDIDLNEMVDEIRVLFRKNIQEKEAVISSETLPHITGYRSPMLQVFQNLVDNALKYTPTDRAARINISCTETNDHWQFAVRDNGIGIDQEYFDKIFIIFQRLHDRSEFSGTGMGLAITKKIIENQGGRIWVESSEGEGSTFYFTIRRE